MDVVEPMSAEYMTSSLSSTYDKYTPSSDDLLSRGIDRLFGEVTKGFQESEYMLGKTI